MMHRRWLLLLALLLAFWLRVWGLEFGLPYEFHADENYYIEPVFAWLLDGRLVSGLEPSLGGRLPYKYLLLAGYWLWTAISPFAPTEQWLTTAWYLARFWSVVFGVLTVALTYPLGRRLYGPRAGLLATFSMAVLFLPVRESHFAVNDAATALLNLLGLYLCVLLLWQRRWRDFLLIGLVVGLAAATKKTGWFIGVAFATAYGLTFFNWGDALRGGSTRPSNRRRELLALALTAVAALAVMLLISVRSVSDAPQFAVRLLNFMLSAPFTYTDNFKDIRMAPSSGWLLYLRVLGWGLGWLMTGLGVWAIGAVFWRRYRPGMVLAVYFLVFFWYVGGRSYLFARFLLPAIAPLVVLAIGEVSRLRAIQRMQPRAQNLALTGLAVLLLLQPFSAALWYNTLITRPDTRLEATDWLLNEFPEDTVIVKEAYAVFPKTVYLDKRWPSRTVQLNERGPTRNNLDYFVAHKTDLIVTSNFINGRARVDAAEDAARLAQQAELAQKAELIKTFNPYRTEPNPGDWFYIDQIYGPAGEIFARKQAGPLLKIYRLPYENQPHTQETPPIATPVQANFADKMMLLGYDLPTRRADPGGAIPITLYWQALSKMDDDLLIFNHLLDNQQQNWGGYDRWPQETAKTSLWHPGEVVVDTFAVPVDAAAPDGVYWLQLGLYLPLENQGVSLPLMQNGQPIDATSVAIGPIKVGGPPPDAVLQAASPASRVDAVFGDAIRLTGFDGPQLEPGQLQLQLYWESLADIDADYTVFAHLRDEAGNVVAQMDRPPANGAYPTSLWSTDEIIPDTLTIPLPQTLPPGRYTLVVGLYNFATGARLPVSGSPDGSVTLVTATLP